MSAIDYPDLGSQNGCVLGPTIDVTWDAVGLDQISSAGLPLVDPTSYDAATGLMTAWNTASGPNGLASVLHSVVVDGTRPRPRRITAGRSGAPSSYFDSGPYEYDAAGNVKEFSGWTYEYDPLQRLTSATTPSGFPRTFTYDDFGNLTEVRDNSVVVKSIAVNAATNRLNGTGMAYDLRGNLVAEPVNGWTRNLRFDLGNRLVASWATGATAPGEVFGFAYDFTGERVLRYERDSGTLIAAEVFLRDESGNLLTELQWTPFDGAAGTSAGSWSRIRDHVYLGREPAVRLDWVGAAPTYTSVVTDHLGSTRAEVSDTGVFESFTYWPYGELTQVPNYASLKGPHLFTAHEREHRGTVDGVMMGLDYMHARYYSSDFGRFFSVDPFGGKAGSSQSWNRYSYVLNSPMVFVDPYGESVSLANLDDEQREKLLQDLNDFTGNTYDVNDEGDLLLVDAGDVARGEASAKAALFMDSLISSDRVYSVLASPGSNQARVTGEEGCVEINFASKDGMIAPDGVDPATFNLGSTLIHELRHEAVGLRDDFGAPPGTDLLEWSGPIIDFVNDIRAERGLYLRKAWGYKPVTRGFFRLREFREHEFYRPGERPIRILVPR